MRACPTSHSLTWENVDLPAKELRFIARKTGKTIILPLDGPLAAHVETMPAADSVKTPLHPRAFSNRGKAGKNRPSFKPVCRFARAGGLKKEATAPQNLSTGKTGRRRRSEGHFVPLLEAYRRYLLKEAGIPQAVVMELVGHDNEEMSQHYTRVGHTALEGAARAFPDLLTLKPSL